MSSRIAAFDGRFHSLHSRDDRLANVGVLDPIKALVNELQFWADTFVIQEQSALRVINAVKHSHNLIDVEVDLAPDDCDKPHKDKVLLIEGHLEGRGWPIGIGLICHTHHIRNTPNVVSGIGAFSEALIARPSTSRVWTGSITPSSQSRAVAW